MPIRSRLLPRALLCASAALLVAAGAAQAHHSYAVFDRTKTITIEGTVYAWEMVNPHSFLWVAVPKPGVAETKWGLEGGGIAALQRAGITKSSVKPGEKVTVALHPLRDGRNGGQLVSFTLASTGKTVRVGGGGEAPGAAAPGGAN